MGRLVGLDGSGCRCGCGCGGNANGECNEDARLRAPMTTGLFSTKTSLTGCLSGCKVGTIWTPAMPTFLTAQYKGPYQRVNPWPWGAGPLPLHTRPG